MTNKPADVTEPPESAPYFEFYSAKFDHDIARNILLHFVHEQGLDAEFIKFIDKHFLEDEDGYR